MKFQEIKDLSSQELSVKAADVRKQLFEMRIKNSLGQLANPLQIRFLKKDLARILTSQSNQGKAK